MSASAQVDWAPVLAEARPGVVAGTLLRLVESQAQVATVRLVSSLERQGLLEEMLEATKPALPNSAGNLHYLLASPFRYPPLKHGSRFGRRHEPSLFYGALDTSALMAESAYYRFVFWQGMAVPPPGRLLTQHTLFAAGYRADPGLDLREPPFAAHLERLANPVDYLASQDLGTRLRDLGLAGFQYASARDPQGGGNVALFTPKAFTAAAPLFQEAWSCETDAERVRFRAHYGRALFDFPVEIFRVDGVLPQPATA
ncbi:MAG TPA: RES family NAD+ phosphorylase [Thiobacillaceae bacterium]|nr:RES family NAD+ phosphorylase [Thiobacillaceae bacterium]HNA82186.1 RES family NAD+ phosphorylase [Thiobacillaceae bacterium]HNH90668.1 RES family NAD+ phosphorylase [Thiobacillaceae bacterium]HNI08891.1 RES family NAD+ phosphorylase [Thiobacillaceae bacterium]